MREMNVACGLANGPDHTLNHGVGVVEFKRIFHVELKGVSRAGHRNDSFHEPSSNHNFVLCKIMLPLVWLPSFDCVLITFQATRMGLDDVNQDPVKSVFQ
jgi:hypothetical protein